eukprot:Nitzschia sp. Nitz4//scaffold115_size69933//4295//7888//NITZ4_005995-RA/size69933-processed-gene-0.50-mRNA-1//1//CDS//3329533478//9//frame0
MDDTQECSDSISEPSSSSSTDWKHHDGDAISLTGTSTIATRKSGVETHQRGGLSVYESKAISWGKMVMYVLLLAIATGFTGAVYTYTKREQDENLTLHASDVTSQIVTVYQLNTEKIVRVCENFAEVITSHATNTGVSGASWPYITVPSFEALAKKTRESIGAKVLAVAHRVEKDDQEEWEKFTANNGAKWIEEGYDYLGVHGGRPTVHTSIFANIETHARINKTARGYDYFTPIWQYSPIVDTLVEFTNLDVLSFSPWERVYNYMKKENTAVLSTVATLKAPSNNTQDWPESIIMVPVYRESSLEPSIDHLVATVSVSIPWHIYFGNLLSESIEPLVLVISNDCGLSFSYQIDGPNVLYLGEGDHHDSKYDHHRVSTKFNAFHVSMDCPYDLSVYPTEMFASKYDTNEPVHYTIAVLCIFLFTIGVFFIYDRFVEQRQVKVLTTAERSNALVASLFPQDVAKRLMEDATSIRSEEFTESQKFQLGVKTFQEEKWHVNMNNHQHDDLLTGSKPIAELFPMATVLFADIVGFTAWSSEREPSQVFELLEQIYSSFDAIAKRRRIFKVETIGDCYMAAAGLPEKRDDHAIAMACFARDCLRKMLHVVRKLESSLGPSTGDLGMRMGLHSGPVTAGVLRGEKARFQLFGDTVNTAARMESTGSRNKIQLSSETAALIKETDVNDIWVIPREDEVEAKGKGKLQTYWLAYANMGVSQHRLSLSSDSSVGSFEVEMIPKDTEQKKRNRSIDWTTDVLVGLLKRVVAMRGTSQLPRHLDHIRRNPLTRPLDEVVEVIKLHSQQRSYPIDPSGVDIPKVVVSQLRSYIREVASMYNGNIFHNFEHATHVTMSVTKLLSRVVTPNLEQDGEDVDQVLHEYTHGITSDPLAQFAVTFAALIHDVDHHGVPNSTLVRERTTNARRYKDQSIAEQNSVDIAWELLALDSYADLRAYIYSTEEEFLRFRQLVVNAVMATDIADKELSAARKARWVKAFDGEETDKEVDANRKATIVIEHLIQASDVAHTMQHWHVYTRWNERYFREMYLAYATGRIEKDPSVDWFRSELAFFDHYVIPLAKKLKECQVFGVASDEYLNYAEANRKEWEAKGLDLVRGYISNYGKGRKKSRSP